MNVSLESLYEYISSLSESQKKKKKIEIKKTERFGKTLPLRK